MIVLAMAIILYLIRQTYELFVTDGIRMLTILVEVGDYQVLYLRVCGMFCGWTEDVERDPKFVKKSK